MKKLPGDKIFYANAMTSVYLINLWSSAKSDLHSPFFHLCLLRKLTNITRVSRKLLTTSAVRNQKPFTDLAGQQ